MGMVGGRFYLDWFFHIRLNAGRLSHIIYYIFITSIYGTNNFTHGFTYCRFISVPDIKELTVEGPFFACICILTRANSERSQITYQRAFGVWEENQGTRRKPIQAQGKHTNSM